jgi:putative transposase
MQLIAGRTAQEFNHRKKRRGTFWEGRYFATAVSTDEHLVRCLVYNDLQAAHFQWVTSALNSNQTKREPQWTEPIAVGSNKFIRQIKDRLGPKAYYRKIGSTESNLYFVKEMDA